MDTFFFFTLFSPLLFSSFFFLLECIGNKNSSIFTKRTFIFISFGGLAILASLGISPLMDILINFYSSFNVASPSYENFPSWLVIIIIALQLDLANYLTHRFMHFVPFLWRFHRLHHSDKKVNALTTLLHHPLEVIINSVLIVGFYVAFDLPIILIIFYNILLALHSAFVHSTIRIPKSMEKWVGYIFVMPGMHRSHHSIDVSYGNANYGSIFSIWDRLLGTYKQKEVSKTNPEVFGVDISKAPKENSMQSFLINPLV